MAFFNDVSAFGASSSPMFGSSAPAFRTSSSAAFGTASSPTGFTSGFGASPSPAFGRSAPASGTSSSTAFANASSPTGFTSGFGASPSPAFGSSAPAFGTSSSIAFANASSPIGSTSGFGASSSPAFTRSIPGFETPCPGFGTTFAGSSVFEQNPASERSGFMTPPGAFGNPSQESQPTMNVFGTPTLEASSKPAFGVSSTPASSSNSTPAFGHSPTHSGATYPAFGIPPTLAYRSTPSTSSSFSFASAQLFDHSPTPFGVTSTPVSPFGARATTPAFGDHGFSQFKPVGSRVYAYSQTTEDDYGIGTQPAGKLDSISAMPAYKEKTHEELRWEDYQTGDKVFSFVSWNLNPAGQSSGGTEFKTNNMQSNLFSTPFGPATSPFSTTRSTDPFVQNTFGTPGFVSSSHTAPESNPFGPAQAQTPSLFNGTLFNRCGTPTSHSLFGTPSSIPVTTQAQGTTSLFANGINPGTQSANLFQSSSPAPGQTSLLFGQPPLGQPAGSPFVQAAPYNVQSAPAFSQPNAFARNMFSSTPSSPSTNIMGWWNPINPFPPSPLQSAQATQNPAYFVAPTGGRGVNQNSFEQMFTNLFGALQATRQMSTTVAGEPAPMRLSCMSSNDGSFMMMEFQNLKL